MSVDNEEKRKFISDRLLKREHDRLANMNNKRSERLDKIVNEETFETFKPKFIEFQNEIKENIEVLEGLSKEDRQMKIQSILNKIQNLQMFLSEATKYLTTFHIEKCSEEITGLRNIIADKHINEQKQKKFNFKQIKKISTDNSSKVNESKSVEKPSTVSKVLSNYDSNRTIVINNLSNITKVVDSNVSKMEIVISNITNCTMQILGNPSTVHINDLIKSNIFIGPVSGSVFVNNVSESKLHVACHQLRIHKSISTDFYIHVTTKAIIEDCKSVEFGRFNWKYSNIEEDFVSSQLNMEVNNWNKVDDFNWLVADVPSPNWKIIGQE